MNYKKITRIFLVSLMALVIVSPSVSLAVGMQGQNEDRKAEAQAKRDEIQADRAEKKEEMQADRAEKTCTQLSTQAQQIQARLTERIANLTQKRTETASQIQQRVTERTAQRTEKRAQWEETKTLNWEKLRAAGETTEQKAAIEKFITAVQTAVKVKTDAINKIVTDYRAAIQTQNNTRKTEIDTKISAYKNQVASIVSQVKADCAAGKDAKEIRTYFKTEMQKARNEFQAQRKTAEKFKDEIAPIKEAKKAELKAVIATFKASVEAAKTELRATFPKTTNDSANTEEETETEKE